MIPGMFPNLYLKSARKNFGKMLKGRYPKHDEIVERVMSGLTTQKDVETFFAFIGEMYEAGYVNCVDQYKEELEKQGIKVKIVPGKKE